MAAARRSAAGGGGSVPPHGAGLGVPSSNPNDLHPAYRLNPYVEHLYSSLHSSPTTSLRGMSPLDPRGNHSEYQLINIRYYFCTFNNGSIIHFSSDFLNYGPYSFLEGYFFKNKNLEFI